MTIAAKTIQDSVDIIERLVESDVEAARRTLRKLLFDCAQAEARGSTGDALAALAEQGGPIPDLGPIVLRFNAVAPWLGS